MASVKNLKKEINFVLGDLINIVYVWEITHGGKPTEQTNSIIEEIYEKFDFYLNQINQKDVENKKAHFANIRKEYEKTVNQLVEKINVLD